MPQLQSDTSRWSLVVHRVTNKSVELWAGTLFPNLKMPERARLRLRAGAAGQWRNFSISKAQWKRPFEQLKQRFYVLKKVANLTPGKRYSVVFERQVKNEAGALVWQELRTASFETMPTRLPASNATPFTVALASCFFDHRDGGAAAAAYKALYERGPRHTRPHLKFLTGDQVYLDIGFDSLSTRTKEVQERIASDYQQHWRSLGSILSRGGTWMLPDDHEYWNDYPYIDTLVPTLLTLRFSQSVRKVWKTTARDGVKNVQRSVVVDTINLGGDLSICVADLRSYRGKEGGSEVVMHSQAFAPLLNWAKSLSCPGVLVVSQQLIAEKNSAERNLISFRAQYQQLVAALGHSGHDIVLLSGDVHFGRIATCPLGNNGARLVEIIGSPLSNLTGVSSISTATPKHKPKKFPPVPVPGWAPVDVKYDKRFDVPTRSGFPSSAYLRPRTREHFVTVSFNRLTSGEVQLKAQSWLVRERNDPNHLPTPGFSTPFSFKLR